MAKTFSPRPALLVLAASGMALAGVSACTPIREYHGYVIDEVSPTDLVVGEDTRSTVLAKLGSPSTTNIFEPGEEVTSVITDDPVWIYVTYTQSTRAYLKPTTSSRTVVRVTFDDTGTVTNIEKLGLEDGQDIQFASRETPTRGKELGLLEQIFGTVGRVRLPEESDNPTDPRRRN